MFVCVCAKTSLVGLTGNVQFDQNGLRSVYRLDVMEASLGQDLQKVIARMMLRCIFDFRRAVAGRGRGRFVEHAKPGYQCGFWQWVQYDVFVQCI